MTQEQVLVEQLRLPTAGEILLYADFLAERGDERAELALTLATHGDGIRERIRQSVNDLADAIEPSLAIVANALIQYVQNIQPLIGILADAAESSAENDAVPSEDDE